MDQNWFVKATLTAYEILTGNNKSYGDGSWFWANSVLQHSQQIKYTDFRYVIGEKLVGEKVTNILELDEYFYFHPQKNQRLKSCKIVVKFITFFLTKSPPLPHKAIGPLRMMKINYSLLHTFARHQMHDGISHNPSVCLITYQYRAFHLKLCRWALESGPRDQVWRPTG